MAGRSSAARAASMAARGGGECTIPCPREMVPGTCRMISPTMGTIGACTASMRLLGIYNLPMSSSVRVFVTGGTFDKEYNELTGTLAFQDTHLPEMLRLGRCRL